MLTPKFKLLTRILFEHYKIELFYLQIIIFLSSILQILSILSFGPFIIIITNASNVQNIYDKFSFLENFSLNNILFLSICFVTILFMVNNILSIYVSKIIINFCKKLNINFSNYL